MVTFIMFCIAGVLAWVGMGNPEGSNLLFMLAAGCAVFGLVYHPFRDSAEPVERNAKKK